MAENPKIEFTAAQQISLGNLILDHLGWWCEVGEYPGDKTWVSFAIQRGLGGEMKIGTISPEGVVHYYE